MDIIYNLQCFHIWKSHKYITSILFLRVNSMDPEKRIPFNFYKYVFIYNCYKSLNFQFRQFDDLQIL